jgi:16S rRNA (cytidine1402-2'-O)-methyltransferase
VISILNENTSSGTEFQLIAPLMEGNDMGLMSDAGCPGVADPGADVVNLAHQRGIEVVPLAGPSSILMSIMASGFTGQNFAFNGYLPIDKMQRQQKLKDLENLAKRTGQAQFFIETPYRNVQLMEALVSTLNGSTLLFIGCDITSPAQFLKTRRVREWKVGGAPGLQKVPAVFGIFA